MIEAHPPLCDRPEPPWDVVVVAFSAEKTGMKLAKHIMAPVWLQGPLLTLALLFSRECYAQGRDTRSSRSKCAGNRQSPIVIIPDKTTHNPKLGPVSLSDYGENKKLLAMMNTGKEELAKHIMAPAWLQGPLLTLALLFSRECYAQGPSKCAGNRQSPIDIIPDKTTLNTDLGHVSLSGYGDSKKLLEIYNTGLEVSIELGDGLYLRAYGLPATYGAKTVRFHWGNGNSKPGSEHYLGGRQFAMELQILHTKDNKDVQDALNDENGIAALGFFVNGYDKATGKTAEAWKALSDLLPNISAKGTYTNVNDAFSLLDLLGSTDFGRYYRYLGSLTTGDCNEVVIWTIFAEPILVPPEVVEAFPKLYSTNFSNGPHLESNFRPLQKIGERIVEGSASLKDVIKSASFLDAQPAICFLLLFITLTFFLPV
ncbi:hypothetical protein lerEdw1_020932 [Lerista edwardsae]|nr:hypothetical protein lerEdw1_020932 [Lerista edwardsae]